MSESAKLHRLGYLLIGCEETADVEITEERARELVAAGERVGRKPDGRFVVKVTTLPAVSDDELDDINVEERCRDALDALRAAGVDLGTSDDGAFAILKMGAEETVQARRNQIRGKWLKRVIGQEAEKTARAAVYEVNGKLRVCELDAWQKALAAIPVPDKATKRTDATAEAARKKFYASLGA